jgi:hypothetical protein
MTEPQPQNKNLRAVEVPDELLAVLVQLLDVRRVHYQRRVQYLFIPSVTATLIDAVRKSIPHAAGSRRRTRRRLQ